jgi:hypothetical protein
MARGQSALQKAQRFIAQYGKVTRATLCRLLPPHVAFA